VQLGINKKVFKVKGRIFVSELYYYNVYAYSPEGAISCVQMCHWFSIRGCAYILTYNTYNLTVRRRATLAYKCFTF